MKELRTMKTLVAKVGMSVPEYNGGLYSGDFIMNKNCTYKIKELNDYLVRVFSGDKFFDFSSSDNILRRFFYTEQELRNLKIKKLKMLS